MSILIRPWEKTYNNNQEFPPWPKYFYETPVPPKMRIARILKISKHMGNMLYHLQIQLRNLMGITKMKNKDPWDMKTNTGHFRLATRINITTYFLQLWMSSYRQNIQKKYAIRFHIIFLLTSMMMNSEYTLTLLRPSYNTNKTRQVKTHTSYITKMGTYGISLLSQLLRG